MLKRPRKIRIRSKLTTNVNTPIPAKKCKVDPSLNLKLNLKTMHPNTKVEVLNNPVKSANDKKEYK